MTRACGDMGVQGYADLAAMWSRAAPVPGDSSNSVLALDKGECNSEFTILIN